MLENCKYHLGVIMTAGDIDENDSQNKELSMMNW